jgi:hypothetical protein
MSSLNTALGSLEESHVKQPKQKLKKIKGAMKREIFSLTDSSGRDSSEDSEVIAQLKEKFHIAEKMSKKVKISMVYPKS